MVHVCVCVSVLSVMSGCVGACACAGAFVCVGACVVARVGAR